MTRRACVFNTVQRAGLCYTIIARAMSMKNSLLSSLECRPRVLDELQVGRDASYDRWSVTIFAMKYFDICENVRHDITPFLPCCSWSLFTIVDISATHHTHTPP